MSYQYQNISDQEQLIPGVGLFKPGEEFTTEEEITNKNFKSINAQSPQKTKNADVSPTLPKSE